MLFKISNKQMKVNLHLDLALFAQTGHRLIRKE